MRKKRGFRLGGYERLSFFNSQEPPPVDEKWIDTLRTDEREAYPTSILQISLGFSRVLLMAISAMVLQNLTI